MIAFIRCKQHYKKWRHRITQTLCNFEAKTRNGLSINRHLDLLIRTANEYRLSNFMLAQAAYAHIHILK